MELEKTTIMSAIVWTAGLLAEVIFHDALSQSIFGIVLSIVMAIIVIIATYFTLDGINAVLSGKSKETLDKQLASQEQMFKALNNKLDEHVKLGQAVYEKLDKITTINRDSVEKNAIQMFANSEDDKTLAEDSNILTMKDAVEEINSNTLKSAKIIVKYQMKNSKELKDTLDLILEELSGTEKFNTIDNNDNNSAAV